jgi:hypothetical protein
MIDASIPLQGRGIDLADIMAKSQQYRANQGQMADKKRLRDLVPQAAHGGQGALDELWGIDPRIAEHMDDRQRKQALAKTKDLGAAVRWADTPEKWNYVQQHYGQQGVDLSSYGFEDRERGLVALNQISGYLKDPPKPDYRAIEPGGSLIDVTGGNPRVVIAPNEGGHPMGAPVGESSQDVTATGPNGQKLRLNPQTNQWEPMGGPTPSASGGFPH